LADYEIISPDANQYRKLVKSGVLDFPGSVFYEPEFLVTTSEVLNLEFKPILILQNNNILGIANHLISQRAGIRQSSIPRLIQYYGPVIFSGINKFSIGELLPQDIDLCIFSLLPEMNRELKAPGWHKNERLTYYLDTNEFEKMLSSCAASCKNKISKAVKNNIEVVENNSLPMDIYAHTFSRRNMTPPIALDTLAKWTERLSELGLLKTFIARQNSISIAFRSILYYGRYAYDWVSGALPEALRFGANNLLVLKVGEQLYNEGITHYDLVSGDIKSIADFKKSFGSKPVNHIQIDKTFSLKGKLYRGLMKMRAKVNG